MPSHTSTIQAEQDLARAVEELRRELSEALRREAATAEILRVVSRSRSNVQPVFDTIVKSAVGLCDGLFCGVYRFDGELLHHVAHYNYAPAALAEVQRKFPARPTRDFGTGRAILERTIIHIPDVEVDPEYRNQALSRAVGMRSGLFVPMLQDGTPVGVVVVARAEPGPFSDNEIELLKTIADQAVIAIENARLFEAEQARTSELTERTRELTEALEYQTATSKVLSVISGSPSQVQPVLDSIAETAGRLCRAENTAIWRFGDALQLAAHTTSNAFFAKYLAANPLPTGSASLAGRVVLARRTIHIPDVMVDPVLNTRPQLIRGRTRTALGVPLLRDGVPSGVIVLTRQEVLPFTDKQIEMVTTFADQAVIAIENARLFEAEQARTKELTESLEYQTALADVLSIISRSPSNLQPVLDAIAASARRLCAASDALIERLEADRFYNAAHSGTQMKGLVGLPLPLTRQFPGGRAVLDRKAVIIDDIGLVAESEYPDTLDLLKLNTIHSVAEVPLLSKGRPLGSLAILRAEVHPFTNKEVAMLETFADQAVIAIENTRLFEEVQARTRELSQSLEQQTATSEVLQIISSSPGNLEPVFEAMLSNAVRVSGAKFGAMHLFGGDTFRTVAMHNAPPAFVEMRRRTPVFRTGLGTALGRAVCSKQVVQIPI